MNLEKISSPFTEKFPGDFSGKLTQRQTPGLLFTTVKPEVFENPELILFNEKLSEEIGLGKFSGNDLDFLVGKNLPENIQTYATAYAGHQFGNWAGQLGDGRAILAGEIKNNQGKTTELQWKGAGATPYSRFADGRAVLRSSVREYLMSEAMFHLNIETSRALSLCKTGEKVVRDIMYNGNPNAEEGAVVLRTAPTFIRFGHFELLSARGEFENLKNLANDTIANYFPEIKSSRDQKYMDWFEMICKKTADLMVDWFRVGFVHGVMNTDNMSILGLTIDYGPFSFVDEYDLNFTPNTTDLPGRRYAFGKQGQIAQWNLWKLANALLPLIKDEKFLEKALENFGTYFWQKHDGMLANKFGFEELKKEDQNFFSTWQNMMQELEIDYTLFFNRLEKIETDSNLKTLFDGVFYRNLTETQFENFKNFIETYKKRLLENSISAEESKEIMQKNNPKFILRNYLLYQCIGELNEGKQDLLQKLLTALENPYHEIFSEFSQKRPSEFDNTIGCSTLSCSS